MKTNIAINYLKLKMTTINESRTNSDTVYNTVYTCMEQRGADSIEVSTQRHKKPTQIESGNNTYWPIGYCYYIP